MCMPACSWYSTAEFGPFGKWIVSNFICLLALRFYNRSISSRILNIKQKGSCKSEAVFKSSVRTTSVYSCCLRTSMFGSLWANCLRVGKLISVPYMVQHWDAEKRTRISSNAPRSKPQIVTRRCVEWRRWRLHPTRFDCGEGILWARAASTDDASGMEEAVPLTLRPASTLWWSDSCNWVKSWIATETFPVTRWVATMNNTSKLLYLLYDLC
jgi:hypothetical protein